MFPGAVRALGVGFAYAVGNAMFGGTAEYVALSLKSRPTRSGFRGTSRRRGGGDAWRRRS